MKQIVFVLTTFFAVSCVSVRQCKNCVFINGVIHNSKVDQTIKLPHWNDSVLVFVNKISLERDTFLVINKDLKEVDKGSFQIEKSSKDYLEIGISLKRKSDSETFRLYFGQYTCVDDLLELNISVFDFWDWATMKNNMPTKKTLNTKLEELSLGGRTYQNVWSLKPDPEWKSVWNKRDIQTIFWNQENGLVQYESWSTGMWYRDF